MGMAEFGFWLYRKTLISMSYVPEESRYPVPPCAGVSIDTHSYSPAEPTACHEAQRQTSSSRHNVKSRKSG